MALLPDMDEDPTLVAMFAEMEKIEAAQPRRSYLGASSIGEECWRKLWYSYNGHARESMPVKGIMATEDGHRTEDVIAARLRLVPGIKLWTHDADGEQFGFALYDGRFKGHYDGVIEGLLQAPKTPHIWENKACNEKKFKDFLKCKEIHGEKNALQNWNYIYYAQAQVYMGQEGLTRHYLTVALAGGRDVVSARTEFNKDIYETMLRKAESIINMKQAPARISEDPAFFKCKMCDHARECHAR